MLEKMLNICQEVGVSFGGNNAGSQVQKVSFFIFFLNKNNKREKSKNRAK